MWNPRLLRRAPAALVLGLALLAAPAQAQAPAEGTGSEGMWGAASALATLIYGPAKVVYAAGGSLVAGLAWVYSGGDRQIMQPILDASLRGDYVLTPSHLRGERPIEFIGRSAHHRALRAGDAALGSAEPIQSEEIYRDGF